MSSLNKVQLIGNVGKEPEIRSTSAGKKIANITVATSESWKDKSTGEKKEATEWHKVVCYNDGLCGVIERYVNKGDKIYVEGKIKTRKWQDKEGNDRYSTEIDIMNMVMLSVKSGGGHNQQTKSFIESQKPSDLGDDIPF